MTARDLNLHKVGVEIKLPHEARILVGLSYQGEY